MYSNSVTAVRSVAGRPSSVFGRVNAPTRRGADSFLYTPVSDMSNITEAFYYRSRASARPSSSYGGALLSSNSSSSSRMACEASAVASMAPVQTVSNRNPLESLEEEFSFDAMETLCICVYDEDDDEPLPVSFTFPAISPLASDSQPASS